MDGSQPPLQDETDAIRVQAYRLLARLLSRPPDATLLAAMAGIEADTETEFGRATRTLAQAAASADPDETARAFNRLFIGLELGEVTPYASWYLEGMLHGTPLIRMRDDLARLGLSRADGICEPEDHAAVALDTLAGLIDGSATASGRPASEGVQAGFFQRHVAPWMPRLFTDIRRAEAAPPFYAALAAFGAVFLEIEDQAFALPEDAAGTPLEES